MPEIVASNALIEERAVKLRELLNAGHALCLFQNDFKPLVSSALFDFTEATFPGYLPKNLNGAFGIPKKVIDGEWQTTSIKFTWTCTGDWPAKVYGWFVRGGGKVKLSHRFFLPVTMIAGQEVIVRVDAQVWSITAIPRRAGV